MSAVKHIAVAAPRFLHGHGRGAHLALGQIIHTGEQRYLAGELRLSKITARPVPRVRSRKLRKQFPHHLANSVKLVGRRSPFRQDRIIVVGCDLRKVRVPPCGAAIIKAKIRPALEHIEIDAGPFQERFHLLRQILRIPGDDLLPPPVKPSIPELHTHQRPVSAIPFQKCLQHIQVLIRPGTEVGRRQHAVLHQTSRRQGRIPGAVGGKQRYLRPVLLHQAFDLPQIFLVISKGAVLILYLHHDDRAAPADLQVADMLKQLPVIRVHLFQKQRRIGADLHIRIAEQPCRKPAKLPLGTDERAWTQDHVQPHVSRQPGKCRHILIAGKVKLSLPRLVDIPGNIGFHRVEAHGL